uniref:Uncharacterized protein n=1 Tax=Oryza sativa subsp. japonica TaxID=39947 RepID=Q5Z4W4_ORYSJ|nr:hypothetical protein [Oryza sativa Japonica Group]
MTECRKSRIGRGREGHRRRLLLCHWLPLLWPDQEESEVEGEVEEWGVDRVRESGEA